MIVSAAPLRLTFLPPLPKFSVWAPETDIFAPVLFSTLGKVNCQKHFGRGKSGSKHKAMLVCVVCVLLCCVVFCCVVVLCGVVQVFRGCVQDLGAPSDPPFHTHTHLPRTSPPPDHPREDRHTRSLSAHVDMTIMIVGRSMTNASQAFA